MLNIVD